LIAIAGTGDTMNSTEKTAQRPQKRVIDPLATEAGIDVAPARTPLRTVEHCRIQLAKLYRQAKAGLIEPATATKLAYLLVCLRQTIEVGSLETEISSLRAQVAALEKVAYHGSIRR
jgi:hypothetical protein